MPTVIALDLSLTGLGVCAIPARWDPASRASWVAIRRQTFGTAPGLPLVARADAMAKDVVSWIMRLSIPSDNGEPDPRWFSIAEPKICHEGYPIGGRVYNLDKLCEVGGIVKLALWQAHKLDVWAAPQSSARKLICGKLPQRDRKQATIAVLRQFAQGALDDATDDECDAIVAANLYRKELGLSFAGLEPVDPVKKARPGKRARAAQLELGRTPA